MSTEPEVRKPRTTILQMGPSHPAMHGIIKINLELDGETVLKADVEIGYLHRAFEKHSEDVTYFQVIPWTDRLNYVSPLINNFGYAMAVEKLMGIEVTERCRYIRVIMSEISRITDHLTSIGASAMELGALTAFLYFLKAREYLYELVEMVTGARITVSYVRIGGVKADLPDGFDEEVRERFAGVREALDEVHKLLTHNRIFIERMRDVGAISAEEAIAYGFTGPLLRAAGVSYDVRKHQPYLIYDQLDWEVPLGTRGDNYDKYLVRMKEMEQSMRIVEQCLAKMPKGPVQVDLAGRPIEAAEAVDKGKVGAIRGLREGQIKLSPNFEGMEEQRYNLVNPSESEPGKRAVLPPKEETYTNIEALMQHFKLIMLGHGIRPPKGEVYQAVEGGNGELGFYLVSDGTDRPYRLHCRAPCFFLMSGLHRMIEGGTVADVIPTFGQVNMIGGELDR